MRVALRDASRLVGVGRVKGEATRKLRRSYGRAGEVKNRWCKTLLAEVLETDTCPETDRIGDSLSNSLTDVVRSCADRYPNDEAVVDPHRSPPEKMTFKQLREAIEDMARALRSFGIRPKASIGLFAENSPRWIVADQATMKNGAIDAVRGASAPPEELWHIVSNADCTGLIVQDASVLRSMFATTVSADISHLKSSKPKDMRKALGFAVILWDDGSDIVEFDFPVYTYDEAISIGRRLRDDRPFPDVLPDDIATIVYTSGTSGIPKGVQLTHRNILYQLQTYKDLLPLYPGNQILSLMPPWHIYERAVGYYALSCGCRTIYSDVQHLKSDLTEYPSDLFAAVPLILESLHDRVMAKIRGASLFGRLMGIGLLNASMMFVSRRRILDGIDLGFALRSPTDWELLKAVMIALTMYPLHLLARLTIHSRIKASLGFKGVVISGGGSLSGHLDLFFESVDIPILNGWGLTETSPVLCCRLPMPYGNVRGSVGWPFSGTEIKVVDPISYEEKDDGVSGLLLARGPGVMKGYRDNREETRKAFPMNGWFDTGDRGWRVPYGIPRSRMGGCIVLTGRVKDTIVLSSGENIEPQPLEDWLRTSPMIHQMMITGQDRRSLGALVYPNKEHFKDQDGTSVRDHIQGEIWKLERSYSGFVRHMHIAAVEIIQTPFSVEDGTLTRTMKIRRSVIAKRFEKEIAKLNARLR